MSFPSHASMSCRESWNFLRGGPVGGRHPGQSFFASLVHLPRPNPRRYGGYIVHFGVIVIIIGFAGAAFNQDKEKEMGFGDKMAIGPYTLVCRSYTQEDKPNYGREWAIIDVFKRDRQIDTIYSQQLFFKASQQMNTRPTIHSTLNEDLYLVYEG